MTKRGRLLGVILVFVALQAAADQLDPPPFYSATGQFTLLRPAEPPPPAPIEALDGKSIRLSQFRGKVVVLNFWASWCAACLDELPSLDRLATNANMAGLEVIAVAIDKDGARAVKTVLASQRLSHLKIYLDPAQRLGSLNANQAAARPLSLPALPATYIIGKDGLVAGYVPGAARWDTPEAARFLAAFLKAAP